MKKILLIFILFSILFAGRLFSIEAESSSLLNDSYNNLLQGREAFNQKDYEKALVFFEALVKDGKSFEMGEYEEALKKLIYSYLQLEAFEKVINLNSQIEETPLSEDVKNYSARAADYCYYNLLLKAYKNEEWQGVKNNFKELTNFNSQTEYIYLSSLYQNKDFLELSNYLEKNKADTYQKKSLLAKTYIQEKKYKEAAEIYSLLEKENSITDSDRREFGKIHFIQKSYALSKNQFQKLSSKNERDYYMIGLCEYNLENWKDACEAFEKINNSQEEEIKVLSSYYKGISYYKLSQEKEAYAALSPIYENLDEIDKKVFACQLLVETCILQGLYEEAEKYALELTRITSGKKKENAIISLAEIYSDSKNYSKAISLLEKHTDRGNLSKDFMIQAYFALARAYQSSNLLEKADETYLLVEKKFPQSFQAEQALVSRGLMYYSAKQYALAEQCFTSYLYDYPDGKYSDSAYYYSGECSLKAKDYSRSIMQTNILISKYPASSYEYGGYRNLLTAYYETKNYQQALQIARKILKKFDEQAMNDGIALVVLELEKVTAGLPREIAEKETEYEKAGKENTLEGRIIGSQLIQLYARHEMEKSAYDLAISLLEKEDNPVKEEAYYAGNNASFIATYFQKNSENKKAAEYYLKAATYYRAGSKSKNAAEALYSAVNSFVMAGLKGDGEATAKLLLELYPNSKQALHVGDLL